MEWNGMEWNGMEWNGMEWMEWLPACLLACLSALSSHLGPGLVKDFHIYGPELRAAAPPAEPRFLHRLVHVDAGSIADLVPAEQSRGVR